MSGETNLDTLLRSLSAELVDAEFVFVTRPDGHIPSGISPVMEFREAEGVTLIVNRHEAEAHGLDYAFPCRMITLNVHSSLEAVGFMAKIAGVLAEHGFPVNPVSGFYHDHIFVPVGSESKVLALLNDIAAGRA